MRELWWKKSYCDRLSYEYFGFAPIPVAARSMAGVCGRLFAGVADSTSTGGHGCLSPVRVVCCQVEISASG
jgi:hypothetical protein